eukprot:CAMPEP_0119559896 /NCGR_PEP_ID=MMETSP1352-20130426/13550_1 /TAXON_ID=265584 /ORGANISM="Stauroneis constricta, Strain CCMP1120" /LENGTH=44 /DNA_ID= /DNA_START= /DNA_END= /DNA_ORIENTATION=
MSMHPRVLDGKVVQHGSLSWESTFGEEYFVHVQSTEDQLESTAV